MGSKVDWPEYHRKRQSELTTFWRAARAVLAQVGPPRPEPGPPGQRAAGRPGYSSGGMLLANLLRIHLCMTYRDLESFLGASPTTRAELGLARTPGRDTIHRHAQGLTEAYLQAFNDRLVARLKKTNYASPWMPPVSRSASTQDRGALPRIPPVTVRTSG